MACLLVILAGGTEAQQLNQLSSFGFTNLSAANPCGALIEGSDGLLYGTSSAGGSAGQGTVFRIAKDGSGFAILKAFGASPVEGSRPVAALLQASDGALYGTTEEGGQLGMGTLFRVSTDGSGFATLKSFSGADGAYPECRLLEASDGLLYGSTSGGGTNDYGTVFRIGKDGLGFESLVFFGGTNGANPEGGLIEASDGLLYGTTYSAVFPGNFSTNGSTVFHLDKDGGNFGVLKTMTYAPASTSRQTNGWAPESRLVEGTNGLLYGTVSLGGVSNSGAIFQIGKDGSQYSVLYQFAPYMTVSTNGRTPIGGLLLAGDGMLYGTTSDGGTNGNGTVFRIRQDGSNYSALATLTGAQSPMAGLLQGSDGALYGTAQLGGDAGDGAVFKIQPDGTGFTVLTSFSASGGDGQSPYAAPLVAADRKLYGTTRMGGLSAAGTIFSLRFDGRDYRQLLSLDPALASSPIGSLLQATNGLLYGDTRSGGPGTNGALFQISTAGAGFAITASPLLATTGQEYRATLIEGSDGALYGTSVLGGSGRDGTVFRVNPDGSGYVVLKNFGSGALTQGANPMQALLEGSDGKLYGTACFSLNTRFYSGGSSNNGVVFSLDKDGNNFAVLKAFGDSVADGANPLSPLLEGVDGRLYGTTYAGGATNNAGLAYALTKDGLSYQVLWRFLGINGDGSHPSGNLVQGPDGALYGTTERGGVSDQGTLFTVSTNGTNYSVLASFGADSGAYPRGGLTLGPDGALYGTTSQGGALGYGAIFRFGMPIEEIADFQVSNGVPALTCVGIPGTNYWVERTAVLGPQANWTPLLQTNTPAGGMFFILDVAPPPNAALYRMKR